MFRLGGGGGGGVSTSCILVVSGPITMKFCTSIDYLNVTSNIDKDFHKINDIINNYVIIMRSLSFVKKHTQNKKTRKIQVFPVTNGHIKLKFCTGVAHGNTISHTK